MRKQPAPITTSIEEPRQSTMPATSHPPVRSKRTRSTSEHIVLRVSKRLLTQSDVMGRHCLEEETCSECKKKDKADRFLSCAGKCSNKIHRSCLPQQFGKKTKEQSYECDDCVTCAACKERFPDAAQHLKCHMCFVSYHSTCYRPNSGDNIRIVKEKRFTCSSCQKSKTPIRREPTTSKPVQNRPSKLPTVAEAREPSSLENSDVGEFFGFSPTDVPPLPILRSKSVDRRRLTVVLPQIEASTSRSNIVVTSTTNNNDHRHIAGVNQFPDATEWSQCEVYEYFKKIFPGQAHIFAEEEITGEILYKLRREDVIGQLKLKLGPAIAIYEHVRKMQEARGERS